MQAQEKRVGSIANNIANVNTAGYRKSRVEFQDMLYDKLSPAGAVTGEGTQKPTGLRSDRVLRQSVHCEISALVSFVQPVAYSTWPLKVTDFFGSTAGW